MPKHKYIATVKMWRELDVETKKQIAEKAIQLVKKRVQQKEISEELKINRYILVRLVENNGLAVKGVYKRKSPPVIPNPLVWDIDQPPDPNVLLYPENVAGEGCDDIEGPVSDDDLVVVDEDSTESAVDRLTLGEIIKEVQTDLNRALVAYVGSPLDSIKITMKDGNTLSYNFNN